MRWQTVLFRLLLAGLLVPALGLTALRLIEPGLGVLVRLTSFTPVALVLYAAAFTLVLGKLVFPARESVRDWTAIMAVVVYSRFDATGSVWLRIGLNARAVFWFWNAGAKTS